MNYSLIRHLILKDVRHQRIRLILIWLMAFLLPLINFLEDEHLQDLIGTAKAGMLILFCFLIIFNLVSAILLDPTCGSTRFLTTRPIKWTTLLLSKVLFALLFLWMPIVILRVLTLWTIGVYLSFFDQALYLLETTIFTLAGVAIFVLPSLFFQRLTTVIITIVGCSLLGFVLFMLGSVTWSALGLDTFFAIPTSDYDSVSISISRTLIACLILGLTPIPIAILRYWKPSLMIPTALVFAGFFLSGLYFLFWEYPFDEYFSDAPPPISHELPLPLRDQIHVTVQNPLWNISRLGNSYTDYEKEKFPFRLEQKLHVEGVIPPFFIGQADGTVKISLLLGKKLMPSHRQSAQSVNPKYDWLNDYIRRECANIKPTNPNFLNSDLNQSIVFYGQDDHDHQPNVSDSELPGASVQGSITLKIYQLKILKVMPLISGARFDLLRECYEIRKISSDPRMICLVVNNSSVPLLLRGDPERSEETSTVLHAFVVVNRRTGEILESRSGKDYTSFDGLHLQWFNLTRFRSTEIPQDQPMSVIPSNWLDDADICFYTTAPLGQITFPYSYTINNIVR